MTEPDTYWQDVLDKNNEPWQIEASRRYLEGCGVGESVDNGPEPSLDAAIRAACLPNMRKQLDGEDITAEDIAAEQAALDAIRGDAAP